jgi:hypothetical protein
MGETKGGKGSKVFLCSNPYHNCRIYMHVMLVLRISIPLIRIGNVSGGGKPG